MLHKSRFRSLTIILVINFVMNQLFTRNSSAKSLLAALLYTVIAVALIWAYRKEKERLTFLLILNLIMSVFRWINIFVESNLIYIGILISASFFFLALIQSLFRSLMSSHDVDADTLYGSVAIYFLLGNLWNSFYSIIFYFNPRAFYAAQGDLDLLYFSFVTLVGLGFGDIVPVSELARLAAASEGIVGTLYVAIVISRVVGLYISGKESLRREQ
jgi:voltage-gated potassium channel